MRVVRRRRVACSFSAESAERIIVALDGMAPDQALAFSARVQGLRWVKVGLELYVQAGPEVVMQLRDKGLRVFLDLKFHDIPATMAGACRRAAALGAGARTPRDSDRPEPRAGRSLGHAMSLARHRTDRAAPACAAARSCPRRMARSAQYGRLPAQQAWQIAAA